MAFNVLQLPGMSGSTGEIVQDAVEAIETIVECVGTAALGCFASILEFALQPLFSLFLSAFTGRPKVGPDSASDDTALFLLASSNPVAALWGLGVRNLEAQGIPTSVSGGAGLQATINLANAVLKDFQTQFDTPGTPAQSYNGQPVTGVLVFGLYRQLGFAYHDPDSNAGDIKQRESVDQLYTNLVAQKWIDPNTGFPFPQTPSTPIIPVSQPPAVPPGTNGGQQAPCPPYLSYPACLGSMPGTDSTTDELQNLINQMLWLMGVSGVYLMNLYELVSGGASAPPANSDPVTCQQLTGLMNALTAAVGAININVPPSTPPDLTPIVNALVGTPDAGFTLPAPPATPPAYVAYTQEEAAADIEAALESLPFYNAGGWQ